VSLTLEDSSPVGMPVIWTAGLGLGPPDLRVRAHELVQHAASVLDLAWRVERRQDRRREIDQQRRLIEHPHVRPGRDDHASVR
jgi:hypothetical protein